MFVNQRKIKSHEVVINNFTESTSVSDKVLDAFIFLDTFMIIFRLFGLQK